jgi:hypothetical protein
MDSSTVDPAKTAEYYEESSRYNAPRFQSAVGESLGIGSIRRNILLGLLLLVGATTFIVLLETAIFQVLLFCLVLELGRGSRR